MSDALPTLESEYGWFIDGIVDRVNSDPQEFVQHFGVKGMKWGVRNEKTPRPKVTSLAGPDVITRVTKSGHELTLEKNPPPALARFIGRYSKRYREGVAQSAFLTIKDKSGEKIGDAEVVKKSADELNLVWLGIDKSARGNGYASAAMEVAVEYGRSEGYKKITLEVPGNSPDAHHIYKKLGFEYVGKPVLDKTDSVWGGLTNMVYNIDETKQTDVQGRTFVAMDKPHLAHYGVKGMKWGVRKNDGNPVDVITRQSPGKRVKATGGENLPASDDAIRTATSRQKAKASTPDALSTKELQDLVNRMELEQKYYKMTVVPGRAKKVQTFVKEIVGVGNTYNEALNFANSPAGKAMKDSFKKG